MKNKSIVFIIGIVISVIIGFLFMVRMFNQSLNNKQQKGKLSVVTTLYPLYDFAKAIGGDKVNVVLLLPPGVEPHAFEPKPNDIVAINQADVFIYTGEFMELWAHDILRGVTNKNLKTINTSVNVEIMKKDKNHEHDDDENHEHGDIDPHVWLDFENVKIMVDNIAKGLSEKDPANRDYYASNANSYKRAVKELDKQYRSTLAMCRTKQIVYGGHYAFGYLTKRYGLGYFPAVKGFEPETEPTANDLAQLVSQVKENDIRYIFYEELASPKVAETIGQETGAKLLLLNAGHNVSKEDLNRKVSFLSIMRDNLVNLKIGLECR